MKRRMPSKEEIERRAVELYMGENIGITDITPERHELQEEGFLRRAQHELMSTDEVAGVSYTSSKSQMHEYLEQMATEMRLKIVPKREFREHLRKAEAFDMFRKKYPGRVKKVNGYRIMFPAIPQPTIPQVRKTKPKIKPKKPALKKAKRERRLKPVKFIHPVPKIVGADLKVYGPFKKGEIARLPDLNIKALSKHDVLAEVTRKPKKKRKKNHTQRTGKTMRSLRHVKGVKVFSFPDDVWKVRK